jgi:hypothetical protein
MGREVVRDDGKLLSEVIYVLKLSEIFFESFGTTGDRATQWPLLAFLLSKEKDSRILVRSLTEDKEFKKFLDDSDLLSRDYVFKTHIADFRNKQGALLQVEKSRKKDRALTLTDNFHHAASHYVALFVKKMGEGRLTWNVADFDRADVMECLKFIIGFQKKQYLPAWLTFGGQLAAVGETPELPKGEIQDELRKHAPYWCLLLTAWRKYLGDSKVSVDISGLYRAVYDSMRDADPDEIKDCISYLSNNAGPRILIKTKMDGDELYLLNSEKYAAPFEWYTNELRQLHSTMLQSLQSIAGRRAGQRDT